MLELSFIRDNPDKLRTAIAQKGIDLDLDLLLALDKKVRGLKGEYDRLGGLRRKLSEQFRTASPEERAALTEETRGVGAAIQTINAELAEEEAALKALLLLVPNIPDPAAPIGPDAESNVVVESWGDTAAKVGKLRDHVELMEMHGWADFARVAKVSGPRTYALRGRLARLELAMLSLAMDVMAREGFTTISVPSIAREQAFFATGHFPFGRAEAYEIPKDELFLAGTCEVVLNSLHSGEILDPKSLPILYAGFSPCFRREAGSAGKDVRGLLRVHQFMKVEQYVICKNDPEEAARWHARILGIAKSILESLELPYRVVECATGDMGAGKVRMHDIETWLPSAGTYRETHSCSNLGDWQARRANLRYRDESGKVQFANTLNNTALATPRVLAPLLENHQTEDGRVRLPAVIRPYMGGDEYL